MEDNKMNIAVTGFYGTGSSAVIDLLSEYSSCQCAIGNRYEHYPFLLKDCIFDLENRIFAPSANYMIVDYALNSFIDEMKRQNDNNFGWYGSYKELYKDKFMHLVDKFVDNISEEASQQSFSYATGVKFSLIKCGLQLGVKILKNRKIYKWGRVFTYKKKKMRFLKVDHDEFMRFAKEFINDYFKLTATEDKNMIYDHLLLPEQCNIIDKFFDDNFKFIIVDRDPRDIYISDQYIWNTVAFGNMKGPFPNGIESFCRHWAYMHHNIISCKSKNVLVVQFEDLIYNYEETKQKIEKFCGLNSKDHDKKQQIFEPNKSINNTQVFNLDQKFKKDKEYIEEHLSELIYSFPYEIKNNINQVFDK